MSELPEKPADRAYGEGMLVGRAWFLAGTIEAPLNPYAGLVGEAWERGFMDGWSDAVARAERSD